MKNFWCQVFDHDYSQEAENYGICYCNRCQLEFAAHDRNTINCKLRYYFNTKMWPLKVKWMHTKNSIRRFFKKEDDVPF